MGQRNQLIDTLRGFSMIVIIFTHATAFFPSDKIASTLWNWSNFAVPIFIFCSAYLVLQKNSEKPLHVFSFLKKRFIRLLVPYYIFLPFFLIMLLLISEPVTTKYVWQSVLVIGGVDINWLVLLFLCITLVLPFFIWSRQKSPFLFWIFFILSLGSAIFLLFGKITMPYKFIMWLPWSVMLYFTWFFIRFEQKKKILFWAFIACCLVFGFSYAFLSSMHHSTVLIHNKYPPNLLYLSYGIAALLGLTLTEKLLFRQQYVLKIVNFFSKYSYSLYFLHYFILTFFAAFMAEVGFNWLTLFLAVLLTTVVLQKLFIWVRIKLRL